MKTASLFREAGAPVPRISIVWECSEILVPAGNLAAGLMAAGILPFRRTPVSGAPRGPFCMMGTCYDCLVEIDGVNRQACMTEAAEGMVVRMPVVGNDDAQG